MTTLDLCITSPPNIYTPTFPSFLSLQEYKKKAEQGYEFYSQYD